MIEEIRVIVTVADRHMIGIKAENKENVNTAVVRMLEKTVQRMERNALNVEEKVCTSRGDPVHIL